MADIIFTALMVIGYLLATKHQCHLASTKLYQSMSEAYVCAYNFLTVIIVSGTARSPTH